MKRFVLDTNLFIDAARDRAKGKELATFSAAFLPKLHLHAVVVQELLAGAVSAEWRREIGRALVSPFERRGRIVTPDYASWKRAGEIISELIERRRMSSAGIGRSFLNDVLLAVSCGANGLTLITKNTADFELIGEVEAVRFVKPWPKA